MKELILIRHAETDMQGRYCGHANPRVNASGHRQIHRLLYQLHGELIDTIVTSDLQRAVTTARALADTRSVGLALRPQLREIFFGEWEGLAWTDIERRNRDYAQHWIDSFPHLPAPGGETYECFEGRVLKEIDAIRTDVRGDRIAIVTHAGVLRVVLQVLAGATHGEAIEATKSYCCWFKYGTLSSLTETAPGAMTSQDDQHEILRGIKRDTVITSALSDRQ